MTEQNRPAPRGMSRYTACAVLLLLSVCVLYGCGFLGMLFFYGDGHTRVIGEVVDPDGKPIGGAEVRLSEQARLSSTTSVLTDEAGRYDAGLTHAPRDLALVLTVTKDGYKPHREEFKSRESGSVPGTIVLEPDPQGPGAPKE